MIEIPGYTLLRPLGQGGMAKVYLAVQQSLGREVALKILSPALAQDADASARFLREARVAANLHHPHIVPVHDVGMHEGLAYIAMQFETGGTISSMAGACDASTALRIIRDIAIALDYAHGKGVVHRDIKPDNILRRADGSCVLSDFGIARVLESNTALTQEGTSIGTPQYMSPEQLRGDPVDGRSDLYSLGVVFYQLLTGELPYAGSDGWAIGMQHINADIPRLPSDMVNMQPLLSSLMAKLPGARPETGAEVVRRVDALLAGADPVSTVPLAAMSPLPRRPAFGKWLVISLISLISLGLLVGAYALWQRSLGRPDLNEPTSAHPGAKETLASAPAKSIAVLPFTDLSPDHDQEYFSDGMAEEILDALAQVKDLKVAGRTSSFYFRGKSEDLRTIGKVLGVENILEGSVRKQGDKVRITVQLIQTKNGFHLWSQSYDGDLKDVFEVQERIARAITDALKPVLDGDQKTRLAQKATLSVEAHQQYLRGRYLWNRRGLSNLQNAVIAFKAALAADPAYADAWAALAQTYAILPEWYASDTTSVDRTDTAPLALDAAEHALRLDPDSSAARLARAYVRCLYRFDWAGAEVDYRLVLGRNQGDPTAHQWYAELLFYQRRWSEAAVHFDAALKLDPLATVHHFYKGEFLFYQSNPAAALPYFDESLRLTPDFYYSIVEKVKVLVALRRFDQALAVAHDLPEGMRQAMSGFVAAMHDRSQTATAVQQILVNSPSGGTDKAEMLATLGQYDLALTELERLFRERDPFRVWIYAIPAFDPLHQNPRFQALLKQIGLPLRKYTKAPDGT